MGISIWQLLIILLIVALLFGTKKLRNIGGDLGSAIKSFKSAMGGEQRQDDESERRISNSDGSTSGRVYDAKAPSHDLETERKDTGV